MKKHIKTGLAALALTALLATGAVAPSYAAAPQKSAADQGSAPSGPVAERKALAELRQKLATAAEGGDQSAIGSLKALDGLGNDKRAQLAGIILNEGVIQASQRPDSGVEVIRSGDCTNPAPSTRAMAATLASYNVTANCDAEFTFAGVSVTKVRLTGSYVTGNGVVLSTSNATAYIMHSYEPGSAVSFSNFSHNVSGGRGNFQVTVTVTRSIFGWNHSTRSANLRLVTSGPGVVSCGWVA